MASTVYTRLVNTLINQNAIAKRSLHASAVLNKTQAGRYRPKPRIQQKLTYEMANPPHQIAHRKSWNSWNTSSVKDGPRRSETAIEDMFIRQFMFGTWYRLLLSEIIIKRQHNYIRLAFLMNRSIYPGKAYFLCGYTEEFLGRWLHCPVKLEIITVASPDDVIYKII